MMAKRQQRGSWRVFKKDPTRTKYTIEGRDHLNVKRRMPAFRDQALSEELARHVAKIVDHKRQNAPLPPILAAWVQDLAPDIKDRLAGFGLLDAHVRPLREHLADYEAALRAKGNTEKYVKQTVNRVQLILDQCGIRYWSDVSGSKVQRFVTDLKTGNQKTSTAATKNKYLDAFKSFARWAVQDRRLAESPVEYLKPLDARKVRCDSRQERRALSVDQVKQLLNVTKHGPERWRMTGHERAMLYRLAVETGLRASELRRLTRSSFRLDGIHPVVMVEAGYNTKQRVLVDMPLRPGTADELREFLANKLDSTPAFSMPRSQRLVYMLREDLEMANIPYRDETGRVADLHSLRHTCGSLLAASGAHPKVIQRLMRHSTITLTMDRYTHAFKSDETEAVAKLPDLSRPGNDAASATGTFDAEPAKELRGAFRGAMSGLNTPTQWTTMDSNVELPSRHHSHRIQKKQGDLTAITGFTTIESNQGRVPERTKGADCKSVGVSHRGFESHRGLLT